MATFTINKKGGYEVSEVDGYIKNLEQQLNEYKDKSAAINKAIISAQVASDNMIKASQEEASKILQKAKDNAAEIQKKAEEEKAAMLKDAGDLAAQLKKSSKSQLTEIKANLSQQKEMVSSLSKDYDNLMSKLFNSELIDELTALKAKYTDNSAKAAVNNITAKIDEIDNMADDLSDGKSIEPVVENEKPAPVKMPQQFGHSSIPSPAAAPAAATAEPVKAPETKSSFSSVIPDPVVEKEEVKEETPKTVPTFNTRPVTATFSSTKAETTTTTTDEKPFIKTGLNNNGTMNGIPVQKSYTEPEKTLSSTQDAPTKPGIYRVPTK